MSYSDETDRRVGAMLSAGRDCERRKMFGGVCYLLNGNMLGGVCREFLILRLGEKGAREALKAEHVAPFDVTGRPMKGWVMVSEDGFRDDEHLRAWLDDEAREFVETLPAK